MTDNPARVHQELTGSVLREARLGSTEAIAVVLRGCAVISISCARNRGIGDTAAHRAIIENVVGDALLYLYGQPAATAKELLHEISKSAQRWAQRTARERRRAVRPPLPQEFQHDELLASIPDPGPAPDQLFDAREKFGLLTQLYVEAMTELSRRNPRYHAILAAEAFPQPPKLPTPNRASVRARYHLREIMLELCNRHTASPEVSASYATVRELISGTKRRGSRRFFDFVEDLRRLRETVPEELPDVGATLPIPVDAPDKPA